MKKDPKMIATPENANASTLASVKQEKVPVEETFGKVINSQMLETKPCYSNYLKKIDKFDKKISFPLQSYAPNIFIEIFFYIFAKLFNTITVTIYLILILFISIYFFQSLNVFLIVFCHVMFGVLVTVIVKKLAGRERPALLAKRYCYKVRTHESLNSMPSGDCLQAANFCMMFIFYFENNIKYISLLLIPTSMFGRVFYCCHYWLDCFIGAFLGILISYGSYYFINEFHLNNF